MAVQQQMQPQPPEDAEYVYVYEQVDTDGNPGPGTYDPPPSQKTAPEWSMRSKRVEARAHPSPGPGAYEQVHSLGTEGIKPSLHARLYEMQRVDEPGPGTYDHHPSHGRPENAKTFHQRVEDIGNAVGKGVPGPGTYSPRSTLGDAQANSLKSRIPKPSKNFVPGPGTYEATTALGKGNKKTFGEKMDTPLRHNGVPGPGTYNVRKHSNYIKPTPPGYSLHDRVQTTNTGLAVPGPGTYQSKEFGAGSKAPSYSFSPRYVQRNNIHSPGPGAYEQVHSLGTEGIKPSLHARLYEMQRVDEPGPGTYDHHPSHGRPENAKTFHQRVEDIGNAVGKGVPGPGSYSPRSTLGDAQSNMLKGRIRKTDRNHNPGPGTYEFRNATGKGLGTTWARNSGRCPNHSNGKPGPGAYEGVVGPSRFFNKETKPGFSFGASKSNRFGKGPRRVRRLASTYRSGSQTAR